MIAILSMANLNSRAMPVISARMDTAESSASRARDSASLKEMSLCVEVTVNASPRKTEKINANAARVMPLMKTRDLAIRLFKG